MPDLKQLKTFVVSADMKSFSKAARILYTTQSSVSKIIASLEQEMNTHLFRREAYGIELTRTGRVLYRYAERVLEDMDEIDRLRDMLEENTIHISGHPSSWFARRFVEFYNLHYDENPHFEVRNAVTEEVLTRVAAEKDSLGFLYVFTPQWETFRYHLEQLNLEMIPLREVGPMLYLGTDHPDYGKGRLEEEHRKELRLVQMYQDEFARHSHWQYVHDDAVDEFTPEIAVRTNSDYIMQAFLHGSGLANISGASHPDEEYRRRNLGAEIPIAHEIGTGWYVAVLRQGEMLEPLAGQLLEYIREKIREE